MFQRVNDFTNVSMQMKKYRLFFPVCKLPEEIQVQAGRSLFFGNRATCMGEVYASQLSF